MNVFKKLMIKILCCAIVCAVIIPDVYGMKRKADDDQSSAKRNVRARTDATEALRDSADRRQRAVEPETEVPASQPAQQPEQEMDTSSAPRQPMTQQPPAQPASGERDGKDAKQEVAQEAPVELQADEDSKNSSNSSNSGEAKQEAKQAGKSKNIFLKLRDAQLGKKVSNQDLYNWVENLPTAPSSTNDEASNRTDTVIKLILHAPAQVTNFIQLYRMLPEGIDAGSPRCLVLDTLDKEAQKYVNRQSLLSQEQKKEALAKLPAGYLKMKVRALQQGITDVALKRCIERIIEPGVFIGYFNIGYIVGLIDDIIELLIQRDKLEPITSLNLSNNQLIRIEGLNQLVNLKKLFVNKNQLREFNVAGLSHLEVLDCRSNLLQELDVSGLIHLKSLRATSNNLKKFKANGMANLITISLDTNNNTHIEGIKICFL